MIWYKKWNHYAYFVARKISQELKLSVLTSQIETKSELELNLFPPSSLKYAYIKFYVKN